ncbi:hypothetical protein [Chitinophaga barathri]|uniref:Uncharacterized protein n=1 Tax=Chitinophaga barathri TaxID=1647451 RepID=A0A3N4MQE8_9BACT|nr:hypothetical protein [Chitinophaga barathri]RPD41899.1 hypothetical protein EG028_06980 [Chitinophaga barathri]
MATFLGIVLFITFIVHILLNLIIQNNVLKDEIEYAESLPRGSIFALFTAIITLWWKPSGHPEEDKKTLKLMKVSNYIRLGAIAVILLYVFTG